MRKHSPSIQIWGVDTNEERRNTCSKEFGVEVFRDLETLFAAHPIDCVFVCTSPLSHAGIITYCLKKKTHIFTEMNLVSDSYEENLALARDNNLVLFISSTFLYRDEIKRIKACIEQANCIVNYTYHVGQYLPDWHPWESYKEFFVSDKRTNGCRELFAIELPWMVNIFGNITKVHAVKNKISKLGIDYDDSYLVMLEHSTGHKGVLAVDIVSRKAVRNLEIYGENIYVEWDGSPDGLKEYDFEAREERTLKLYDEIDQLDQYSKFIIENAYSNEISSFFEAVYGSRTIEYSFEDDRRILKIIDAIEGIS